MAGFGRGLASAARRIDVGLELSVRSWALRSEVARDRVRRVDERRLEVLTRVWAAGAGDQAGDFGALEYCAFLGAVSLYQSASSPAARRAERLLGQALASLAGRRG